MRVVRVIIMMERIKAIAMKWGACLTCLRNENFTLLSLFFFFSKKNQFSCPIFFLGTRSNNNNNNNNKKNYLNFYFISFYFILYFFEFI